jgi:hypothetical protein
MTGAGEWTDRAVEVLESEITDDFVFGREEVRRPHVDVYCVRT